MKIYLTRQHNGLYMLTKYKPILEKVEGREFEDSYIVPGEPIGVRNLCDVILVVVNQKTSLKRGESILVELSGNVILEN